MIDMEDAIIDEPVKPSVFRFWALPFVQHVLRREAACILRSALKEPSETSVNVEQSERIMTLERELSEIRKNMTTVLGAVKDMQQYIRMMSTPPPTPASTLQGSGGAMEEGPFSGDVPLP